MFISLLFANLANLFQFTVKQNVAPEVAFGTSNVCRVYMTSSRCQSDQSTIRRSNNTNFNKNVNIHVLNICLYIVVINGSAYKKKVILSRNV